ncbi:MAG TPA: MMPL family transporter [Pseudonocardia sp.]|uniref:MMPL family transporter n=1 Tax=Pseudonocardia sp. TaxID=60912 RepID=UPI002CBE38BF|nr:MMPL family transporter [Pseudonocardia sp.]HTF54747.1 MMPL family transporter [Pseudonocardia sp.]
MSVRHVRWQAPRVWGALVLIVLIGGVTVLGLARLRLDTSMSSLLTSGDPALEALGERDRSFGADPIAVLLESPTPRGFLVDQAGAAGPEGGRLPRLLELEGKLAELPDVAAAYGPATVLNQLAASAQNLLAQIGGRRDGLAEQTKQRAEAAGKTPAQAESDAVAALAEFDKRYGSLLALGMRAGLPTLRNPDFVTGVIYDQAGNPRPQWRFVVPTTNSVAILVRPREDMDQVATQHLVTSVRGLVEQAGLGQSRVTVTGVPALTAQATDRVRTELPYLAALALVVCALVLLLTPWLRGGRLRRLLPLALTLLSGALVLAAIGWSGASMSLAIVAFAPIVLGCGSDFAVYLTLRADRRTVVVTALASAASAASLVFSPLPFTRGLGLALGAGLLVVTGLGLWLTGRRSPLPSLFAVRDGDATSAHEEFGTPPAPPPCATRRWVRITALVSALVVAAIGWAGLARLPVEANPMQLARGLPEMGDAAHAEALMGSSSEVGLLVSAPNVLTPAVLDWSRRAETAVLAEVGDQLRPVLTMPDLLRFLGTQATQAEIDSALQLLPTYLTHAVVRYDRSQAVMIFGAKLDDLGTLRAVLDNARAALPPVPPGVRAEFVGLPVVAVHGAELLASDRYLTSTLGVLAAAVVLALGLRRRGDAVRALGAGLLSTGWGLAVLTALGMSVSPLTAALGSLATVTATEFTVLLAAATRHGRTDLRMAVLTAGLAATGGYLSLVVSQLQLLSQFGLLLAVVVGLSYLAGRLVVWASVAPETPAPASDAALEPVPRPDREANRLTAQR